MPSFPAGMSSWTASVLGCCRPRSTRGGSMTPTTGTSPSRWGTRSGSVCFTDRPSPLLPARAASSALSMPGPIKFSSGLERWRTAYGFRTTRGSMMCFTSGSLSPSVVHQHRLQHRLYHLYSMGVPSYCRSASYVPASAAEFGTSSSSGRTCRPRKPHGSLLMVSAKLTPRSSSRTSCFPRGEEMLWSARRTGVGIGRIRRVARNGQGVCMQQPRPARMQPLVLFLK